MRVEATAGGGMVTVVMNGAKQVLSLKIDPEAVSKDDVEMLQDLILAAINDAQRKADEAMQQQMGGHDGRPEDPRHVLMTRPDPLTRARSNSSSACRASARRARSGSRFTSSRPRARRSIASPTRCARSRTASPTARSAATSPTSTPASSAPHPRRDHRIICVVEEPENVTAVEKTRDFKGVYHVLMGALSPLHGRRARTT